MEEMRGGAQMASSPTHNTMTLLSHALTPLTCLAPVTKGAAEMETVAAMGSCVALTAAAMHAWMV